MVHPYLQGHLENVVLVEPALQQGRKSPSLAAAPGTPVASHPDAARAPTAAPTEPSTPAANGIDPSSVCADPLQDKGAEGDPGQETVVDDGNHVPDTAQPSHADTQEPSVDCSSMAYSMDCSTGPLTQFPYLAAWHPYDTIQYKVLILYEVVLDFVQQAFSSMQPALCLFTVVMYGLGITISLEHPM